MEDLGSIQKHFVFLGGLYLSWKIIKRIWSNMKKEKQPVRVLVTGAAGMFMLYESINF